MPIGNKAIHLRLPTELSRILNQEVSRVKVRYGISVTPSDILLTLIEQHGLRVRRVAEEDEDLLWYYDDLVFHDDTTSEPS